MPFLSRRSVDPLTSLSPPRDKGYHQKQSSFSQNPRTRARSEASLFRRVSTLFTVRRRTSSSKAPFSQISASASGGIGYIHACPWTILPRVSSDSTPHSSLEIRRPSGLGRRASLLLESNDSITSSEGSGRGPEAGLTASKGSVSLPNLLGGAFHHPPEIARLEPECPAPYYTASGVALADSILQLILEFLPREDLPAVALVSRGFCSVARHALYNSLDIRSTPGSSWKKLYSVLASREELAALVVSFCCQAWPSWELASSDNLSSITSGDVRLAFQNMYNLKSLTLPSFVSILSHTPSFTFCLTHLTIFDKKMTQSQLVALRSWLATQPSLESLSFPHLAEYTNTDPTFVDEWTPTSDPNGSSPCTPLLPCLKSLHASAEIVSALCLAMDSPIQQLTLDVRETLYTGLRPSAVLRSLSGVRDMHIIFAPDVDKRTVEKFLGVTGSTLTGENRTDAMRSLEVEVSWTDSDAAETLYGIVTSIISRFRGLETLKLTSPFRSIQASFPMLPSPDSKGVLDFTPSDSRPAALSAPPSRRVTTIHVGSAIRKEFVACTIEQSYAKTWTKHCPSLSDIQFDFSCSTTDAEVELCGVWFRRRTPMSSRAMTAVIA